MRLSGGLAIRGGVLLVTQYLWAPGDEIPMPWQFAPLILGLLALLGAAGLGLARGSWIYRLAVAVGLASLLVIGRAILVPLGPFVPTPTPPGPRPGEVVFVVGLALAALSALTGAVAILRDHRRREHAVQ